MNPENIEELAALNALGALDGDDLAALQDLLKQATPAVKAELASFNNVAALLAASLPARQPASPRLKDKILRRIQERPAPLPPLDDRKMAAPLPAGLTFIHKPEESGWRALPVAGAFVKILSIDHARGYVVALGKLEPGTRYPAHRHIHGEEIYVLTGDLHIGDHVLQAGDFHRAEAGTAHGINYSETGCTILAVVSSEDLEAQFNLAQAK